MRSCRSPTKLPAPRRSTRRVGLDGRPPMARTPTHTAPPPWAHPGPVLRGRRTQGPTSIRRASTIGVQEQRCRPLTYGVAPSRCGGVDRTPGRRRRGSRATVAHAGRREETKWSIGYSRHRRRCHASCADHRPPHSGERHASDSTYIGGGPQRDREARAGGPRVSRRVAARPIAAWERQHAWLVRRAPRLRPPPHQDRSPRWRVPAARGREPSRSCPSRARAGASRRGRGTPGRRSGGAGSARAADGGGRDVR